MKQLLETACQSTPNIVAKDSKTQRREGFRLRLSRQVMTELPLAVTSVFLPLHHHKRRERKRRVIQAAVFQGRFCLLSNKHVGVSGPLFPRVLNLSVSLAIAIW